MSSQSFIPIRDTSKFFSFVSGHGLRSNFVLAVFALLVGSSALIPLFLGKQIHALALFLLVIGTPLALWIISSPRLALYQFVFLIFFRIVFLDEIGLGLIELSAGLLILSAVVDFFVKRNNSGEFPVLSINFGLIVAALTICSFFAYDPSLGLSSISKISLLLVFFLSVYRLIRYVRVDSFLKLFLGLSAIHSLIAIVTLAQSGWSSRVFGFTPAIFDDLTMIAAPIGVVYFLWSPKGKQWLYSIATSLILIGLVATQSRASIIFAFVTIMIVIICSYIRSRNFVKTSSRTNSNLSFSNSRNPVTSRIYFLFAIAIALILILLASSGEVLGGLGDRFGSLLDTRPSGTLRLRLSLWSTAWQTFVDHPFLGVGPGAFGSIDDIYPTLRLDPVRYWVRGLSAHNLLLHYLGETGVLGAASLVALFVRQFLIARKSWLSRVSNQYIIESLSLYMVAALFLITLPLEAGWTWGPLGFLMALFLAVITHQNNLIKKAESGSHLS